MSRNEATCTVEVERKEGFAVVSITGKLDALSDEGVEGRVDQLLRDRCAKVIFDFENLDSMGPVDDDMGLVLNTVLRLRILGGDLRIANTNTVLRSRLKTCRVDEVIALYDSLAQATAGF